MTGRSFDDRAPAATPAGAIPSSGDRLDLSEAEVLDLLERDGWCEPESDIDIYLRRGQTLGEFADELAARWDL